MLIATRSTNSTTLPGLHTELAAAFGTSKGQPRTRALYKDNKLIALCQRVATHMANGYDDKDDDGDNDDNDDDDNDDNDNDNDDNDNDDNDSWYDCWVKKPVGEHGWWTKDGCKGWGLVDILAVACITETQYRHYLVSSLLFLQSTSLTLFIQKSTHRLCNHYFDTTPSFCHNQVTRPAQYALIIEKVCPIMIIQLPSLFADITQMKELHPHFRFHTGDWLTHHFLVMHCQAMSWSFHDLGDDPDVTVYKRILKKLEQKQQTGFQRSVNCRIVSPMPPAHLSARMWKT